jgi:hypothetical protein
LKWIFQFSWIRILWCYSPLRIILKVEVFIILYLAVLTIKRIYIVVVSFELVLFILISLFLKIRWRVGLKVSLLQNNFIIDLVNKLYLLSLFLRYWLHLIFDWSLLSLASSIWTCLLYYWVIGITLRSVYFVSIKGAVRYWCLGSLFLYLLLLAMIWLIIVRLYRSISLQTIRILTLIALGRFLALIFFELFS